MSRLTILRTLLIGSWFALFLLLMARILWLAPPQQQPIALQLLLLVGPLLLPLRGLLQQRPRSYLWISLLALAYLFHAIGDIAVGHALPFAISELLLALLLYASALLALRQQRQLAAPP